MEEGKLQPQVLWEMFPHWLDEQALRGTGVGVGVKVEWGWPQTSGCLDTGCLLFLTLAELAS